MSNLHALLSPSGAHKWLVCAGSVAMEQEHPSDDSSDYADSGTAAHELAAMCLKQDKDAKSFKGHRIAVGHRTVEVDDEMVEHIQTYVDNIRQYAQGGELLVEQRLPLEHVTGEADAHGTGDVLIFAPDGELQVHDLKYGRGVVVKAAENPQLMLYALGAMELADLLGFTPTRVRLVIHQPRLNNTPSEWDCSLQTLSEFEQVVRSKAAQVMSAILNFEDWKSDAANSDLLNAGEHCVSSFCKARATCPKLRQKVFNTITDDFVPMDPPKSEVIESCLIAGHDRIASCDNAHLAEIYPHLGMIEAFVTAVKAKVHAELSSGREVPGYKLVEGRKKDRAWADPSVAEEVFKSFRMKREDMYTFKLISPTQALKLFKAEPKRLKRIEPLITRAAGSLAVAPVSDARPAVDVNVSDDFSELV